MFLLGGALHFFVVRCHATADRKRPCSIASQLPSPPYFFEHSYWLNDALLTQYFILIGQTARHSRCWQGSWRNHFSKSKAFIHILSLREERSFDTSIRLTKYIRNASILRGAGEWNPAIMGVYNKKGTVKNLTVSLFWYLLLVVDVIVELASCRISMLF